MDEQHRKKVTRNQSKEYFSFTGMSRHQNRDYCLYVPKVSATGHHAVSDCRLGTRGFTKNSNWTTFMFMKEINKNVHAQVNWRCHKISVNLTIADHVLKFLPYGLCCRFTKKYKCY